MGTSSGAPLGADRLRALNQAYAIDVVMDERGVPTSVRMPQGDLRVISIEDVWRIEDGWWRDASEQVRRMYFELTLDHGAHLTLYHDLLRGSWYAQRA